ncbi:protein Njmu-R1-like [Mercenaria mercenaria]|uniref:protein Njmu-R1-like n=1 Tax=Mercenaria mercenaria TaxID=6596 RepID=UPI00234ED24C|nr:protein Njmu-R1-like [Mercenaria mercenaria]
MDEKQDQEKQTVVQSGIRQREEKHFAVFICKKELKLLKTSCEPEQSVELQNVFSQRLEKGIMYPDVGTVITVDLSAGGEENEEKYGCYYYSVHVGENASDQSEVTKYLLCFLSSQEQTLDLFRTDLDEYCSDIVKPLKTQDVSDYGELPTTLVESLQNWHTVAIDYLIRCKQALGDSLKFLIYSALHDNKLVLTGGTADLQADIQRFYNACSLSDILIQLRDTRLRRETGSLSGSVDLLVDVDSRQTDAQNTLTVSISADSVRLDSNGCNRFCEEWANAINRPEFQDQPARQKQVIEAFKLKFIQTMNTLKRLLREAENDYYALYRLYVFLRDSGNCEILLHYVRTEGATDVANVLEVLQDFIQEQGSV